MMTVMMMMTMTTMMIKLIMLMMMQVKHKDNYIDSNRNIAVESGSMVPSKKHLCNFFYLMQKHPLASGPVSEWVSDNFRFRRFNKIYPSPTLKASQK